MAVNNCPICDRNDKVEKVSVIYMNGSHNTTMSVPVTEISTDSDGKTYSTTRHEQVRGFNETKLAQALRAPVKPQAPMTPTHIFWYFLGFAFLGFIPGAMAMQILINIFIAIGVPQRQTELPIGLTVFFLTMLIVYKLSSYFSSKAKKKFEREMAEYNSSALRIWERAMDRWNSLYFCHRDGQVFILGQNNSVPLERMSELLR